MSPWFASPIIANFTDFLPLARVSAVTLNYVQQPQEIAGADVVILLAARTPSLTCAGSREEGGGSIAADERQERVDCGSMRWVSNAGEEVADPLGVEGEGQAREGLAFFPATQLQTRLRLSFE